MRSIQRCFVAATLACMTASAHSAEWDHTMLIYLLGAGLDGKTQLGPVVADIDQSFSDVLEHLDVGGMGSYRVSNEIWAHTIDAIYTGSTADMTLASGQRAQAESNQLIAAYDIGYAIAPHFEVLAGVRYNSLDVDLAVGSATGPQRASGSKDWVDPFIGVRSILPFSNTFGLTLRADVGGFDVGSKLAWQAIAWLNWNLTDDFFATLGYRILDTDYEDGSGNSLFKYDIAIHGPGLGFGWRFH